MPRRGGDFRSAPARTAALILIVVLVAACSGCIALEKDDEPIPSDAVDQPWSGSLEPSRENRPTPSVTQNLNLVVPVDPVPVQPGEHLPDPNPCNVSSLPMTRVDVAKPLVETTTVFEEQYSLVYSARGLQVDVVDVPFIITFSATPRHPEPDANSRLVVTVRDPETLRLIADEGYHGIYGSAREKSIKLYSPGRYIVTLDGRFVDVKVTMGTEKVNVPG
ncbi:hypothetical protein [Methanoculleus chikugoensis]|uniref:hypothetical protein n=1 Tax=Methanoculleus chikugoensis TaxID=118126 RepID=UPI000943F631|nr:hypothetical protein [Methanoculleus chikugoensis]